jgi:hypothetical protein
MIVFITETTIPIFHSILIPIPRPIPISTTITTTRIHICMVQNTHNINNGINSSPIQAKVDTSISDGGNKLTQRFPVVVDTRCNPRATEPRVVPWRVGCDYHGIRQCGTQQL